jgi:hypothetical protein
MQPISPCRALAGGSGTVSATRAGPECHGARVFGAEADAGQQDWSADESNRRDLRVARSRCIVAVTTSSISIAADVIPFLRPTRCGSGNAVCKIRRFVRRSGFQAARRGRRAEAQATERPEIRRERRPASRCPKRPGKLSRLAPRAFSSEVDAGSREENASNQRDRASVPILSERKRL